MPEVSKIALVTGAGSGVGRASALALAAAGWNVALVGRRKDALEETASLGQGDRFLPLPADVSKPEAVEAAFGQVKSRWGGSTSCSTTRARARRRCRSTS